MKYTGNISALAQVPLKILTMNLYKSSETFFEGRGRSFSEEHWLILLEEDKMNIGKNLSINICSCSQPWDHLRSL